jgi:lauroyl/myristoyl acyltransferase
MTRLTRGDAALAVRVAVAACVSWVVPESRWPPLTRALGRLAARNPARDPGALPIDEALAARVGRTARSLALERNASGHGSRLYGLREYRPWRRAVPVRVDGLEHLNTALGAGAGAVLWVGRFTWASIITKMGLHGAGVSVSHLSRPSHGFGESAFAVRWLNPAWTRIERRFLRERIVMEPGAGTVALRLLRTRLSENGVVSITVGDEAVRSVEFQVLGLTRRLATGPMHLALSSGAALIPVFTVRDDSGAFVVELEAPLLVGAGQARADFERAVAGQYARRLEQWVMRYPGQWLG